MNLDSRIVHCISAAVDLFCSPAVAFFLVFEDVGLLAGGRMVEGNGSALLVLLVSTVLGVFGETFSLILKGTSVLLILFLVDRLGDVDSGLDLRNDGW